MESGWAGNGPQSQGFSEGAAVNSALHLALMAGVVLILGVLINVKSTSDYRPDAQTRARTEFALTSAIQILGVLIAMAAAVALLSRSLNGQTLDQLFPLVLPLPGGMLLVGANWALALALGAIGTGLTLKDFRGGPPTLQDSQA